MTEKKYLRTVRSFVRREGRMTPRQQRYYDKYWPQYGIDVDHDSLNFAEIFRNDNPINLEIGFGMGHALIAFADKHPQQNYLGVEVHRPGVGRLFSEMEEKQLSNIRVICDDAVEVLEKNILPESLDGVYILFPDPWHKKRHNKRRLIQPAFVSLLTSRLKLGGRIHLATDWQDYAEQMMDVMSEQKDLINIAGHGHYVENAERPPTKFEQRGERLGHGVWDLIFIKDEQ